MTINSGEDVINEVDILVLDKILRTFNHFFVMKVLLPGECDGICKKIVAKSIELYDRVREGG